MVKKQKKTRSNSFISSCRTSSVFFPKFFFQKNRIFRKNFTVHMVHEKGHRGRWLKRVIRGRGEKSCFFAKKNKQLQKQTSTIIGSFPSLEIFEIFFQQRGDFDYDD